MGKTAVFVIKGNGFKGMEGETAHRVIRHLLCEVDKKTLDYFEVEKNSSLKIGDLLRYKDYDSFVFIYGILYITHEGIDVLSEIAKNLGKFSCIAPVSNESKVSHQRSAPPFIYQTISAFKWAASEIYKELKDEIMEVDEIDDFCLALQRDALNDLPEGLDLIDLPQALEKKGMKFGIAKGVYCHRYGDNYESGREDLMAHVPLSAGEVLDVGSARGLFGELLKKRQKCIVTGVETDSEMIDVAKGRLDKVIKGDIEEIADKGILGMYDCIVCGDVLEHLNDPWKVVKELKTHLKKGGLFIASTPNIMNWAIILDQMEGRWDYVPFSILSGTHIRFFTKNTLIEFFEGAGYKIKEVFLQSFEIPPQGVEFITGLKNVSPGVSEEELKASEIVIIAEG